MGWLRLDDQRLGHEKLVAAGAMAELLDVRGMLYAAQRETDGFIPYHQLPVIAFNIPAPKKRAQELVKVGRWHEDDVAGGWWVHDYLDYNPSAEEREAEREAARERMRAARERKKRKRSADVRANQQGNFAGSSDNPVPVPGVPNGTQQQPRASGSATDDEPDPPAAAADPPGGEKTILAELRARYPKHLDAVLQEARDEGVKHPVPWAKTVLERRERDGELDEAAPSPADRAADYGRRMAGADVERDEFAEAAAKLWPDDHYAAALDAFDQARRPGLHAVP